MRRFNISVRNDRAGAVPLPSSQNLPTMGRQVLLAAVCWLTLSKASADAKADLTKLQDNVAEASSPRLYRSIPSGVYASAAPYAAFSFHIPTFASSPKVQFGPIKQESVIVENTHGFLKDSYGNKFVESPQALPYRTAFPQQYVQLQELPAHLAQPLVSAAPSFQYKQVTPHFFGPQQFKVQAVQAASPSSSNGYAINQPYGFGSIRGLAPKQQQQQNPTNNKAIYASTRDAEQFQNYRNVGKSQRYEDAPDSSYIGKSNEASHRAPREKAQLKSSGTSASTNKGKNAAIHLETKPLVPLLDLTLLEPLTFANPLVPQVQHFLPRISSVTYQKLPQLNVDEIKTQMKEIMIQKTKSYESRPKTNQQSQHRPHLEDDDNDEENPPRDVPHDEPEITYEVKSPNYKETYKEKVVNYNKETQMNPVHYTYDMKSEKEPVTYNFVRTTKEPLLENPTQAKQIKKDDDDDENDQSPKHLIYKFKPEEHDDERSSDSSQQNDSGESFDEASEHEAPLRQAQKKHGESYEKKTHSHEKPERREENYHRNPNPNPEKIVHKEVEHHRSAEQNVHHKEHSQDENVPISGPTIQPKEYEEDIRIAPTPKEYAPIKVDPDQHIQRGQVSSDHEGQEPEREHHDDSSYNQPHNNHRAYYQHPEKQDDEKSKRITKEEESEQDRPQKEQVNEDPEEDDKSEEHFEKAYKNAAYGFPAYESRDNEKEVYDPKPYTPAKYHSDFDIEHTPFQQYVAESDDYPKSTRSNYKDARDNTKNSYYTDYSMSKPESMIARYKQKEDYYKMFMKHKPHYLNTQRDSEKNDEKKSAKYTAAPAYDYHGAAQKPKQYFAKYKAAPRPRAYGYDYAKEAPKDSSGAQATLPFQRLKTYTQFVEPQFQYGFEPLALPRLLDSELAAMASNDSPESEKPGTRKKVYKENWYIKKTSTNGRKANS